MARDIFAAMSASQTAAKSSANKTLNKIFDKAHLNISQYLLELSYAGDLPLSYYAEDVKVDKELSQLDEAFKILRFIQFISMGIHLFVILILVFMLIYYCNLQKQYKYGENLEIDGIESYRKKLKLNKLKIREELKREKEKTDTLLLAQVLTKRGQNRLI